MSQNLVYDDHGWRVRASAATGRYHERYRSCGEDDELTSTLPSASAPGVGAFSPHDDGRRQHRMQGCGVRYCVGPLPTLAHLPILRVITILIYRHMIDQPAWNDSGKGISIVESHQHFCAMSVFDCKSSSQRTVLLVEHVILKGKSR